MGTFSVTIEAGDPTAARFAEVEVLVDTGATYTTLPASTLRDLGVSPHTRRRFVMANGDAVVMEMGRTWVRIDGRQEMTLVVFGDDGTRPLLGAVTLEELGLGVGPARKRLIEVDAWLA